MGSALSVKKKKKEAAAKQEKQKEYEGMEVEEQDPMLYGEGLMMPWSSNFELGVLLIDSQHKMLVKLINQLSVAITEGDKANIAIVFDHVAGYTEFHFTAEERLMDQHHYQQSQKGPHKEAHKKFVEKVTDLKDELLGAEDVEAVGMEALEFLKDWLVNHILKVDRILCTYILDKKLPNEKV
ncbi:hypothetical protein ABK040_003321 [Willaertia magna]